ncbi:MAG: hypothetical protein R3D56_13165 [Paracoccaceae bacterium]
MSDALKGLQQSAEDLFSAGRRHRHIGQRLDPRNSGSCRDWQTFLCRIDLTCRSDHGPVRRSRTARAAGRAHPWLWRGGWADDYQAPLYAEALSPVAAPSLIANRDWREPPRIGLTGPRAGWKEWCAASGAPSALAADGVSIAAAAPYASARRSAF